MKYFILIIIIAFVQVSSAQSIECSHHGVHKGERTEIDDFRSDSVDIIHTVVSIDFYNAPEQSLIGNTHVTLKSKLSGVDRVKFDFEGLTVDSVIGTGIQSFAHLDSFLVVNFSSVLPVNQNVDLTVYYHGSPLKDASGWGGFYYTGGFIFNLGVGFEADPHSYGRVWFPCFDNFIERSTFEYFITTAADKRAACNGQLLSETINQDSSIRYHWKLDQPIPSYLACVAVGSYEIVNDEVMGQNGLIPIQLFARASDTNNVKASFINLKDAISKFENAYGDYKFNKVGYSFVPFNGGAMEHATNITYPISAANGGLGSESLMAHELAHMWWGDNITCQTDGDMWINEGWASFSVYLFFEEVFGRETYESALLDDLAYMLRYGHHYEEGFRPVSGQPHEYVYGDHVYKKGALVAHNLRGYLGDEVFFTTIEKFMDHYQFQSVSSDTLEQFFSQETGVDLSFFFRDWVFHGGYNVVVLDSFKYSNTGTTKLFLQQKLRGADQFHDSVPVYYRMYDQNKNVQEGVVSMSGKFAEVDVPSPFEPVYIRLNPRNELAQARTTDFRSITNTGFLGLDHMLWQVTVDQLTDSALIWFDQFWTAPDPIKDWANKPYRMNDNRYWRVSGFYIGNSEMSAVILYNGRTDGSSGYLDVSLVSETEDSLILLYRPSSRDDWEEYEFYTKNVLGSSTNASGLVELSKVLEGEYVFANVDQAVLSAPLSKVEKEYRVFPNPTTGEITVANDLGDVALIKVFTMDGKLAAQNTLQQGTDTIEINVKTDGVYLYELLNSDDQVLDKGKFVLQK
jgi:hypothetical protein